MRQLLKIYLSLVLGLISAQAAAAADTELLVGAAASLQDVLKELQIGFRSSRPGVKLSFSFAASSELVKQALHDAPLDVVLSADSANMDKLAAAQALLPGSRVDLVSNKVVLIVKTGSTLTIAKLADLKQPAVKRIALCDSAVPIGEYGLTWLKNHQLDKELAAKLVQSPNVRSSLALVARGGADAGFVYATDVAASREVTVALTAQSGEGLRVRYPAAILKRSRHAEAAAALIAYLQSPPALKIFSRFGFLPLGP